MVDEGLSAGDVRAFAEMFADSGSARRLVELVGVEVSAQPGWGGSVSAQTWWWEVGRLLAQGKVADWRARLWAAAREEFPAHWLFAPVVAVGGESVVWNVPARLAHFIGREDQLAELEGRLTAGSVVSLVALAGLGGVGKTALAVEFAWRHQDEFDVVWWVSAEQPELIAGYLAELGEALGLAAGAEPAAVFAALRRRGRAWLLVLDNAEDVAAVASLRPVDRRGRVLVTSRRGGWNGLGVTVAVPVLARAESVAFLLGRLPGAGAVVAVRVAGLLGDLALALEQAVSFCEQTGMSLTGLAGLLVDRLEEVIGRGVVAERAGVTVATLWEMSTSRLAASVPAAVELLEMVALCAPDPLPLDLFEGRSELVGDGPLGAVVGDRLAFAETVGALVDFSLATRDDGAVQVHRMVAATTVRPMSRQERAARVAVLLGLLRADLPGNIGRAPQSWPRWRALLPHVRAVVAQAEDLFEVLRDGDDAAVGALVWLCARTAVYLREHAQPAEALPLLERALAIAEAVDGPDHPDVSARLNNLAVALRDLGRVSEALPLFERALAIAEAVYGPDHSIVSTCLNNLAMALQDLGRAGEAVPLLERALAIDEAVDGPDHPDVSTGLNNLASALRDL
ncbi:tetratricopeptide repeat protein, partial [Frankia sp. AgW1.1]|nr:tetratricopeptide repeat protein [Frankia sp. AgW1.1]